MLDFYDPACQQLLGDDAGVNGRKASNYLKVLAAAVKRVHPGVLVGGHNTVEDYFPPGSDKFKSSFDDRCDPSSFEDRIKSPRGEAPEGLFLKVIRQNGGIDCHSRGHLEPALRSSSDDDGRGPCFFRKLCQDQPL